VALVSAPLKWVRDDGVAVVSEHSEESQAGQTLELLQGLWGQSLLGKCSSSSPPPTDTPGVDLL
jgi:hypothetical protein